jgi:hypothetical protein
MPVAKYSRSQRTVDITQNLRRSRRVSNRLAQLATENVFENNLEGDSNIHSSTLHATNPESTNQITNVLTSMVVSGGQNNREIKRDNVTTGGRAEFLTGEDVDENRDQNENLDKNRDEDRIWCTVDENSRRNTKNTEVEKVDLKDTIAATEMMSHDNRTVWRRNSNETYQYYETMAMEIGVNESETADAYASRPGWVESTRTNGDEDGTQETRNDQYEIEPFENETEQITMDWETTGTIEFCPETNGEEFRTSTKKDDVSDDNINNEPMEFEWGSDIVPRILPISIHSMIDEFEFESEDEQKPTTSRKIVRKKTRKQFDETVDQIEKAKGDGDIETNPFKKVDGDLGLISSNNQENVSRYSSKNPKDPEKNKTKTDKEVELEKWIQKRKEWLEKQSEEYDSEEDKMPQTSQLKIKNRMKKINVVTSETEDDDEDKRSRSKSVAKQLTKKGNLVKDRKRSKSVAKRQSRKKSTGKDRLRGKSNNKRRTESKNVVKNRTRDRDGGKKNSENKKIKGRSLKKNDGTKRTKSGYKKHERTIDGNSSTEDKEEESNRSSSEDKNKRRIEKRTTKKKMELRKNNLSIERRRRNRKSHDQSSSERSDSSEDENERNKEKTHRRRSRKRTDKNRRKSSKSESSSSSSPTNEKETNRLVRIAQDIRHQLSNISEKTKDVLGYFDMFEYLTDVEKLTDRQKAKVLGRLVTQSTAQTILSLPKKKQHEYTFVKIGNGVQFFGTPTKFPIENTITDGDNSRICTRFGSFNSKIYGQKGRTVNRFVTTRTIFGRNQ